jgi:cytochrome c oxidase assembly factor CtaG
MTTTGLLAIAWEIEPSIAVGCALTIAFYLIVTPARRSLKSAVFAFGVVLMFLTLVGPLDFLGDDYLFSAHMLEHVLLAFLVPPILIMGLPEELARRATRPRSIAAIERALRRPAAAWFAGIGTMWLWHWPPLYNAALRSEFIHAVEHLSMLVTGTIFWWPIFSPLTRSRLQPLPGVIYLFVGAVANMALGVLFTFAKVGAYPLYMRPSGDDDVLRLIRAGWNVDPQADLQFGGLFMWVGGGLIFFGMMMAVVARWYKAESGGLSA